jgi:hypothetical protein
MFGEEKKGEEEDAAYLKDDHSIHVRHLWENLENLNEDSEHLSRMRTKHRECC